MIKNNIRRSGLAVNNCYDGVCIEKEIRQLLFNGTKPENNGERIYTDKKDGVLPAYNVRTDKFELALEGKEILNNYYKGLKEKKEKEMISGDTESIHGTT